MGVLRFLKRPLVREIGKRIGKRWRDQPNRDQRPRLIEALPNPDTIVNQESWIVGLLRFLVRIFRRKAV